MIRPVSKALTPSMNSTMVGGNWFSMTHLIRHRRHGSVDHVAEVKAWGAGGLPVSLSTQTLTCLDCALNVAGTSAHATLPYQCSDLGYLTWRKDAGGCRRRRATSTRRGVPRRHW